MAFTGRLQLARPAGLCHEQSVNAAYPAAIIAYCVTVLRNAS